MAILTGVATRVGVKPRELKRFVKFLVVGVIGAVVDFGSSNLMLTPMTNWFTGPTGMNDWLIGWAPTAADLAKWAAITVASISFILAILSNFVWNRYWTYPDSRSKSLRRQFAQFFLVNVSGLLIRVPIVAFTLPIFTEIAVRFLEFIDFMSPERLGFNLAVGLAVGIVLFWNFFINRYWTYNDIE